MGLVQDVGRVQSVVAVYLIVDLVIGLLYIV